SNAFELKIKSASKSVIFSKSGAIGEPISSIFANDSGNGLVEVGTPTGVIDNVCKISAIGTEVVITLSTFSFGNCANVSSKSRSALACAPELFLSLSFSFTPSLFSSFTSVTVLDVFFVSPVLPQPTSSTVAMINMKIKDFLIRKNPPNLRWFTNYARLIDNHFHLY